MPRKKPTAKEEPTFTATQVGALIAATIKATAPKQQPIPVQPEPTEEGEL